MEQRANTGHKQHDTGGFTHGLFQVEVEQNSQQQRPHHGSQAHEIGENAAEAIAEGVKIGNAGEEAPEVQGHKRHKKRKGQGDLSFHRVPPMMYLLPNYTLITA